MRAQKFCFAHGVFVRAAHGLFKPRHVAHQQDLNQRPADLRREGFDKKALFRERVQPVDQARAKVSMMCQMKRIVFLLQFVVEKEKSTPLKRIEHHWYGDGASLVGKTVIIVANLKPAKIRGIVSEGMILSAADDNDETLSVSTILSEAGLPAGARVR